MEINEETRNRLAIQTFEDVKAGILLFNKRHRSILLRGLEGDVKITDEEEDYVIQLDDLGLTDDTPPIPWDVLRLNEQGKEVAQWLKDHV